MNIEEYVAVVKNYFRMLKTMIDNKRPNDEINQMILGTIIPFSESFLESAKETMTVQNYNSAKLAIGEMLNNNITYFYKNVSDFIWLANEYAYKDVFLKNPKTMIELYNSCTQRLSQQLQDQLWGEKDTKYVVSDSIAQLDKDVVHYAKTLRKKSDLKSMEELIDCTSGANLNIPIVFRLINTFRGFDSGLDSKMNQIMIDNKYEFAKWSITRKSGRTYDLIERPAMMSNFLKDRVSGISERYGKTMEHIIDELVQTEGCKYTDIKVCGEGGFSIAYKIGGKVLKIGTTRATKQIPNHRRIIQPIIRQEFEAYKNDKGEYNIVDGKPSPGLFVEVMNAVEINPEACKGKLFDIFKEMYRDGVLWTDAKVGNVGILKRDNKTSLGHGPDKQRLKVDPVASGIYGEKQGHMLRKGEIAIIDTDFIYKVGDKDVIWGIDDAGCDDIKKCKEWYEEQERLKHANDR